MPELWEAQVMGPKVTANTKYEELPKLGEVTECPKCWHYEADYNWHTANVWGGAMRRQCKRCNYYWFEQGAET